jgi:DNA-binding beta-propeller fold protein YncE
MRRASLALAALVLLFGVSAMPKHLASRTASSPDFTHFESQQIHPAVLTPSRDRLLVVNTPDAHLVVLDVSGAVPTPLAEVAVGMEPVSVACADDSTAWVVNNLSDDISIVNLNTMHTRQTLRVGDEPNDVVFAGTPRRAYVSVSNEDVVKVYDPATLALVATIPIEGRSPRALATDAGANFVYVAVFHGHNNTALLPATLIPPDSIPQDPDFPRDSIPGHDQPVTGLIVQATRDGRWFDRYANMWNSKLKFRVKDVDVAEISTATNAVTRTFGDMGSTNFNLAVRASDGLIATSSLSARNTERFEERVSGYVVETRAGFITQAGATIFHVMNPQIDFFSLPGTKAEADSAIGTPTALAYSSNGSRAYYTSLATNKIEILNPAANPGVVARVPCVAGPTGIVVDDPRGRIYVLGRYYNQLQTLSSTDFSQISLQRLGMNPTPDAIVNGRKFFYGGFTSSHGDQSCASCHISGDFDNLVWDLGDPMGGFVPPPNPNPLFLQGFDPMKGPMATQSLRGMGGTEPLHWRGDRANLSAFNPAFVTLMGRPNALADSEMAAFSDFVMPLAYPPNPNERLDRTQPDAPIGTPSSLRGQNDFINTPLDGPLTCNSCHNEVNFGPGTNHIMVPSIALGGNATGEPQDLKVPQLRNEYKKTGFSSVPGTFNRRGFGYMHDGNMDNLFDFLHFPRFSFTDDDQRRDMAAYLMSFDTGTAPAVGYQITFDGSNNTDPTATATMDTLEGQATLHYCDLIAKGRVGGVERGWEHAGAGLWNSDRAADPQITSADLRALGGLGSELTVTGVPPGSGHRMGVDRDRDGFLDGDELLAASDPGNPASTPGSASVPSAGTTYHFGVRAVRPNPFRDAADIDFTLGRRSRVSLSVYDLLGRQVRQVTRGAWMEAGPQTLRWDGRTESGSSVSVGVYFIRLDTDGGHFSRTLVRVR